MKKILKKIRMFLLLTFKYRFKRVGRDFYIGKNLIVKANTVSVGDHVYIGNNSHLSVSSLIIDDYTMLASQVSIVGGDHEFKNVGTPMIFSGRSEQKGVLIQKDAWVGHGTIIMQGITIGEGSIVAAGSVVTKSVEPYTIVGGVPAKVLKRRFENSDDEIEHSQKIKGIYFKENKK